MRLDPEGINHKRAFLIEPTKLYDPLAIGVLWLMTLNQLLAYDQQVGQYQWLPNLISHQLVRGLSVLDDRGF